MKAIVIDPGHGGADPGASYKGYTEKNINLSIAKKIRDYLEFHYHVDIMMTRSTDISVSLTERVNLANSSKADFFLSIHQNASGGSGFESYIFNGAILPQTKHIQQTIHTGTLQALRTNYSIVNRGQKQANFHVLREAKMSSLLLEVLFIDHIHDLSLLTNSIFIHDVSVAISVSIANALSLQEKTPSNMLYTVIAGSFQDRNNAQSQINYLSSKGIASFMIPSNVSGKTFFRIQAGAFSKRSNAQARVELLKKVGVSHAFILKKETSAV